MGGYTRKGVLYQGPTLKRGRKAKITLSVAKTPKVSNTVKKAISKAILKNEEVKKAPLITLANNVSVAGSGLNYNGAALLNGWATIVGSGVIPLVAKGNDQNQRNGNVIFPKYCDVNFSLRALPTTDAATQGGNPNPFRGKAFLVRVILYRHRYAIDDFGQVGLMEEGSGSVDLSGNPQQWIERYNRDEYIIKYSKTYKMAADVHSTLSGSSNFNYIDQMPNGHKSFLFGKIRVKLPKKLIYNDSLNQPTNCAYYMAVAVANEDSSAISTAQARLQLSARSYMTYTDS